MALTNLWGTLTNRRSRRSGRAAHQNLLKPPFRWHRLPLRMESLEDRIAPDATPLELTLASQDPAAVTLRLNGSDLQVVPTADPGAPPLASRALADVSEVRIFGDPAKPEAVTIDYTFGGFFWVPGGTSFQGGADGANTLHVLGGTLDAARYTPSATTTGTGSVTTTVGGQTAAITFSDVESLTLGGATEFVFAAPGAADDLTVDAPAAGLARIAGSSGGTAFAPVTVSDVRDLVLDAAANDGDGAADAVTVAGTPVATGLQNLTVRSGGGADTLTVNAADLRLPVAGGVFTLDAGTGADTLVAAGDASFTLTDDSLSSSGGGSLVLVGLAGEAARLAGGDGDNTFDVGGWTGTVEVEGGAGADTLIGPDADSTWTITGAGQGKIGTRVTFTGFENLTGAAGNEDTFVFEPGGGIPGTVEGGAGGFDTIVLAGGFYSTVAYVMFGPDSGTIARDADVITYSGFEPILDTTAAASRTFTTPNTTAGADHITLIDVGGPADNKFAVRSNTGEDVIFTQASTITSLTINALGGADTVVVEGLDTQFTGSVTIDTGTENDDVTINAVTGPGTYTVKGGGGTSDAVRFSADGPINLTNALLNGVVLDSVERAFVAGTTLSAGTFTGQVFFTGNSPRWTEQGPLPNSRGLGTAPNLWDPSAGAIQAVAVDPTDPFTVYVGTVNGGIWRNTGSTSVLFDLFQTTLTDDHKATLNTFANFLEENPRITVEIGGHTDSNGTAADNLTVSQTRAQAVRDYLVNTRLIDASRLTVVPYGEDRPIALNSPTGQQPLNRRVELQVTNWQPVTDAFPSLSISSLAISPLNSQVIYAGIGRTSAANSTGGVENGLLFSNNGGDTWRVLGQTEFAGLRITRVMPTTLTTAGNQVVFVSTFDVDRDGVAGLDDAGGVFRGEIAPDGTGTFVKISNAGSGLPAGHYTDVVIDPGSTTAPVRPVRLYAAGPNVGVYLFTDGTDGLWHAVNNNFRFGTDTDASGADDLLQTATRIKLAVHEGSGTVYAGVIGNVDANGIFNLTGTRRGLIGVFTTTNFGVGWTAIPAPTSTDGGTTYGAHPGRQGDRHFSMAADPTNANVVYIGGDRQPVIGANNSVGIAQFAGRLFRYDTGTAVWEQVVGNNANNTAPHADSRGMVFAGPYVMFEVDDGGIYRLQNPRNDANQGTRQWSNLNRDLRVTEIRELAYDPLNGTILAGTQDNGSTLQVGNVDNADNDNDGQTDEADERFFWAAVANGDGNSQVAVPFDSDANGSLDRVMRYSFGNSFSSNNALLAAEFDALGNQIGGTTRVRFRNGPAGAPLSGLNAQDRAGGFTKIPMVLNSVNPNRMAVASFGIYESLNTSLPPGAGRVLHLEQIQLLHPAVGVNNITNNNRVSALVYGGTTGGVPNADLIIAARNNRLLIRTAAGGAFTTRNVPGAGRITDIAVNPTDWRTVYVTDGTAVFRVNDVTSAASAFVRVTGNLAAIGLQSLMTLEFVDNGATDILLAGGAGGVARLFNPGAATDATAVWTRFGQALPNTVVSDIEYVDTDGNSLVNAGDRLVAGTLGRGAWSIDGTTIASLAQPSVLRVLGADGATAADTLQVSIDPTNPLMFKVEDLAVAPGTAVVTARFADFDQVEIHTRGGADTVIVDHTFDPVPVPGGIVVDGGSESDTLKFIGGAHTSRNTGTDASGLDFVEIRGVNGARQRVLHDDVESVDTSTLPDALDDPFRAIKGAVRSLIDLLTFQDGLDRDVPLFASSVGRAVNGVDMSTPDDVALPGEGAPSEAEDVVEASRNTLNLLRRFIETGTGGFRLEDIAGFTDLDQLEAALAGLDESGTGTVDYTGDLATGFEFTVTGVRKTLEGRADVNLDLLGGSIDVDGLVDVKADVTLNMVFGLDAAHGFYIKSNATPEITISNIRATADGDVTAGGQFGFLGISLSEIVLTMDPGVRFEANVQEPAGDGFITLFELAGNLDAYTDTKLVGDPGDGVKDVTLTGTFAVDAILPGQAAPFTLLNAKAELTWDDITAADLHGSPNFQVKAALGSPAGDALLRFLKIDAAQVVNQIQDLNTQLSSAIGVEVPFLKDGLQAITDFTNFFEDKILDPLTGGVSSSGGIPTVQALAERLATSLGVDPAALGLSFDPATTELTYHLDLDHTLVDKKASLGAGFELADGLADVQFSTDASVDATLGVDLKFGVDLGKVVAGKSPLEWFFIRNPSAEAGVTIEAEHMSASARFGFVGIEVFEGKANANANLKVTLNDPGTHAADGRIDLGELIDGLDGDKLVSSSLTGSASLDLPIRVPFLLINDPTPTADNTLKVTIPDITDPATASVFIPTALKDVGNFKNIDAASLVGLAGQLTFWLDEFRRSDTFANFDVPLIGPALDKILGIADAFRDKLLFDDADDGLDAADKLVTDINAALAAAELTMLRAENAGGKIKIIANDAAITSIGVTPMSADKLGFDGTETSGGGPYESLTAKFTAPTDGKAPNDVVLNISIDGAAAVPVTISKDDLANNVAIGNDREKLVNRANAPTFDTVDQMVDKLNEVLGISGLKYNPDETLTWTLVLDEEFGRVDAPLDLDISLEPLLGLKSDSRLLITADGKLTLTVGVYLGDAPASTKLDGEELLTELNGGIDIDPAQVVTAPNVPITRLGPVTGDISFSLAVNGGAAIPVSVPNGQTTANASMTDLIGDLNLALSNAGLASQVTAAAVGQRVVLLPAASVTSLALTTTAGNAAATYLGFGTNQAAAPEGGVLKLKGGADIPVFVGRLTGDATFNVSLNGGSPVGVTVPQSATTTNRFLLDLVSDVQAVVDTALGAGKVEVGFLAGKLTFTGKAGVTDLDITAAGKAVSDLGLATTNESNSFEFYVSLREGGPAKGVSLNGLTKLSEVMTAIEAQVGTDKIDVTFNDKFTGLVLTDKTSGSGKFEVVSANGTTAAMGLGILRADAQQGETPDGKIEGASIGGLLPTDRFFIQNTSAEIGLHISTPEPDTNKDGTPDDTDLDGKLDDGVRATASFGFVGIHLSGGGAVDAKMALALQDPGTTAADGRISLTELLGALDDIGTLIPAPTVTGGGKVALDLKVTPDLPGLEPGAGAKVEFVVNKLGNPFTGEAPDVSLSLPNLGELLAFDNLELNWQSVLAGLKELASFLEQFEAFGFLSEPIPIINLSVHDLIGVAEKFGQAVDEARANPAGTLQFLEQKLEEAFGLDPSLIALSLVSDNNGTSDTTADDFQIVKVEVNLEAGFSESVGLDFDLGLPFDLGGGADMTASGSVALELDFGFRVDNPAQIFVFDSTGLDGTLNLNGTDLTFRAGYGGLGVFITGGSITAGGTLADGKMFSADLGTFVNGRKLIGDISASDLDVDFGANAVVTLPVYFPTDSKFAGTVHLNAGISYDQEDGFDFSADPTATGPTGDLIGLEELFTFDPGQFSLLDKLLFGVDGIDIILEGLQDLLDGEVFGVNLPLIGDKLGGAADVIGDFRDGFLEDFRQAIEDMANPAAEFASADDADPVSEILFDLLGPGGLQLLKDYDPLDGETTIDVHDIIYTTNIDQVGVPESELFVDWDFKLGTTLVNAGAGIGFDVGIPGLGLETTGAVNLTIDWEFAFGFGLNMTDGFYLDIDDDSELELSVEVTVPGGGITGKLAFLQLTAVDDVTDGDGLYTHLGATFGIDIINRSDDEDEKLGFSELGRIGITPGIAAEAVVDLGAELSLNSDLVPGAATNFPKIVADFTLEWGVGDFQAGTLIPLSELDGNFLSEGLRYVGFQNVGLDLGSYITDLIGPIVEKVQEVTEPIKPFLDFLTTPIPVISELAGPTTLLDIAAMSGLVNPGIIQAIKLVDEIVDLANSFSIPDGANVVLRFGTGQFVIFDENDAPGGGFDLSNPDLDLGEFIELPDWADLGGLENALAEITPAVRNAIGKALPGGGATQGGFSLPIIEDPSQIFGMLLGKPAVLIEFDMAPLTLDAEFSAFFSILGPLGVSINAEFSALIDFAFGYDTRGIQDFAASGFRNPLLLFNGFFVNDLDAEGNDVAELQFDAGLWAAAELNLGIARGGVGGGLFAEIDFDLHDPDDDGRVRINELVTNVLNEFKYGEPVLSPLAIFDVSGALTAELFAFLKIKLGFVTIIDEKWHITDPIELLSFNYEFTRVPTLATELGDGVLQLNMGKTAEQRLEGDTTDGDEHFVIKQGDDANHVLVWSTLVDFDGDGYEASEAQEYEASSLIIGLGGQGNDIIDASGVTSNIKYELEGNAGDDTLVAGTGTGSAKILGGQGNDSLGGSGGADNIFGETGNDTIHGGGGQDWLFADGSVKDSIQGNVIVMEVKASDGSDWVFGDGAEDLLFGAGGSDTMDGGDQDDVLIGDVGEVTVSGRLATLITDTARGTKGTSDHLSGGGGADRMYAGIGDDTMDGGAGNDLMFGEAGRDSIGGGTEADTIYAGDDNDTVNAGAGNDSVFGEAGNDVVFAGDNDDWVYGSIGLDEIHGDGGADHLYGQSDPDRIFGDVGDDFIEGGQANDSVQGGADNDVLVGGYGSDVMDGEGGSDSYQINARGGSVTELTTAYDTGPGTDTDILTVLGTSFDDTFLLRAMADAYFPVIEKLHALVEKWFESDLAHADKLPAMIQSITDAYGPHDLPAGLVSHLTSEFGTLPGGLTLAEQLAKLQTAVTTKYQNEQTVLGSKNDTGFVAMINDGGADVERFNYRLMEGLVINTVGGDDLVVSDDVIANTTIHLGLGNDRTQIGQVFKSPRVGNFDELITNITAEDVYATTEITRGWLSHGISLPTTINGGEGNDEFTVFHNIAVLNLNGGEGDDLFTIRAFALAGSTDSERARTDMKGDGGADTILYVLNAPVGVDGGDGFDTVRVIGTEFSDDFVVTDSGVFGAGLNINYVNIEKLIADGAEGDDRFFVQSTGLDVVTELDGGLGSDTFFVGGNPSNAPIPVISNDFKGHSGIILHSVESNDTDYKGLAVEGVSANVADNEERFFIVTQTEGGSRVSESNTNSDTYTIRLARQPSANVIINLLPMTLPTEDKARAFRDLEFLDAANSPFPYQAETGEQIIPALVFTPGNWHLPQTVRFRAFGDTASEGERFTFISHNARNSFDPLYAEAQLLSVKVQVNDDDKAGVVVTPTGTGTVALEGGFADTIDVALTREPTATVKVELIPANGQITLSKTILEFTTSNWSTAQKVTVTATDDSIREGFHTDFIAYKVTEGDGKTDVFEPTYLVDGDFNKAGDQPIPDDKPTSFVFLKHRPDLSKAVTIEHAGTALAAFTDQDDDVLRYQIVGNTVTFYKNGDPISITGEIKASYTFTKPGYLGATIKDSVVDLYDNDAAAVIIEQTNGSTDVIEGGVTDTYTVVLSQEPDAKVQLTIDAVPTRTTSGKIARFNEQVEVSIDGGVTYKSAVTLEFTDTDWFTPKTIHVRAINDKLFDGSDTQVFAPELQTVNKIRGPLLLEGAAGAGTLSLPAPLMLPDEVNIRPADGVVQGFESGTGFGAIETMFVTTADLQDKVDDDPDLDTLADLVGKTIELTEGPGTGIVLDPARPRDLYDRFWLITAVADAGLGQTRLTLQNPSMVEAGQSNVTEPVAGETKYAVTSLSINFFADEKEQVDYTMVFDDQSVADEVGALTSAEGFILEFEAGAGTTDTMTVRTADLQAMRLLNNNFGLLVDRTLEISIGPGLGQTWTIDAIVDGTETGTKVLTLSRAGALAVEPTDRSEFRIAGGDSKGRIVGFGMGPNVVIGDRVQAGGITYGDMEVMQVNLGLGKDQVRVDYTTNAEDHATVRDGDFYTLTMLNTGGGDDIVTARLDAVEDGAISIVLGEGNDQLKAADSSLPLVAFGFDGADTMTAGSGGDILFGDIGRVDYVNADGQIITRLGHFVPLNPVNPKVTGATANSLTDSKSGDGTPFETEYGGLVGLMVQAISPEGHVQFRRIIANDGTKLTIDSAWDTIPVFDDPDPERNYNYRVSTLPEDQTDGSFRGAHVIWSINREIGAADSIQGGAGADQIFGGKAGDVVEAGDDGDVVFGDNGRIDLKAGVVTHLFTTDTVEGTGGADTVHAGTGDDIVLGGPNGSADLLHGDADNDIVLGDNGEFIYNDPAHPELATLDVIRTLDIGIGGGDEIHGDAGADLVLAGTGNDTGYGGTGDDIVVGDGDDIVVGDFAEVVFLENQLSDLRVIHAAEGGSDVLFGNEQDDVLVGGALRDFIDGDEQDDLIFGDAVEVHRRPGNITNPRFQALRGQLIYSRHDLLPADHGPGWPNSEDGSGQVLADGIGRDYRDGSPEAAPSWAELEIIDLYIDEPAAAIHGDDYIAGGQHSDQIFGQRGNDVIQGDGGIEFAVDGNDGTPLVGARRVGINDLALTPTLSAPSIGTLEVSASFETAADGDDYIEGNAGTDVIFGGLGQDDLVGGSSTLFSLTALADRADGDDLIFGGSGQRVGRNAAVEVGDPQISQEKRHARDADAIAGDNANILRLVGTNGSAGAGFLSFNYDSYTNSLPAVDQLKIIPRAVHLLDYTPGGPDFNSGAAGGDIGGADEAHGESGDDLVYGMTGHDVLFGDGDDDDLVGGYGKDWISGGTGDDGVLGDDGRLFTSRNSATLGEPLYGIAPIPATQLNLLVTTPGKIQQATINVAGALKKTADLTPFNLTPDGTDDDPLFDPAQADDVIYGGLGNDALHAGAGDDAVSGAEATQSTNPALDFFRRPVNLGAVADLLRFDPNKEEFEDYDEFEPRVRMSSFLLNFDAPDGPAAPATGYATVNTDGADVVFGDLGNDWVVGGTGRDNLYGGWGSDLLNADDDLGTNGGANDAPDTHPSYEDRAFGGAGRDVLIGNTGGDRLIDWVGEFNSYLVPFAPFGFGTVSRTLQPQLAEFLYAVSRSDGADPTRAVDTGADSARNGEPEGELGVIRQQDFVWQEQTGGPIDPQAGNIPGGPRDVLRSANFNDGQMAGFAPDSGRWTVQSGALRVSADTPTGDAVAVYHIGDALPGYFEVRASILAVKPTAGWNANAYIIFDYNSKTDFKFAGIDVSLNKLVMGRRTAAGWIMDRQTPFQAKPDVFYNMLLSINGNIASLVVDNQTIFTHAFTPRVVDGYTYGLNWGMVGFGSDNARGIFDNVAVQILPPQITLDTTENFDDGVADLFTGLAVGTWQTVVAAGNGRYVGTPLAGGDRALSLVDLGIDGLNTNSYLELSGRLSTLSAGGFVFDAYGPDEFKFVYANAQTGQVIIGHRTSRGWAVDASATRPVTAGADFELGISLKGSTASATVNGQVVVGHAFNAVVVDGGFGVLSRDGSSSFDSVRIKTNDPAFANGPPMLAEADAPANPVGDEPAADEPAVKALLDEAIRRMGAASGELDSLRLAVADLPGRYLGQTHGSTVYIDVDAAGWGWFIDPTPADDSEFTTPGDQGEQGRMDLLTVVMHELGHVLGWARTDTGLMAETLAPGTRFDAGLAPTPVPTTIDPVAIRMPDVSVLPSWMEPANDADTAATNPTVYDRRWKDVAAPAGDEPAPHVPQASPIPAEKPHGSDEPVWYGVSLGEDDA